MTLAAWLPLFVVCLLGAVSPGPSLAVVLRATIGGGQAAGLRAALAHGAGVGLYGLLTVTGLAVLLTRSPALFLALQVAGALYLLWLGAKSLLARSHATVADAQAQASQHPATEGFLVAFLNPKLAVFMIALFSQFLAPEFGITEKAIMVVTVGVTDAAWYGLVATLVSRPAFLARLRASEGAVNRAFGVILIALALSVIANALLAR